MSVLVARLKRPRESYSDQMKDPSRSILLCFFKRQLRRLSHRDTLGRNIDDSILSYAVCLKIRLESFGIQALTRFCNRLRIIQWDVHDFTVFLNSVG